MIDKNLTLYALLVVQTTIRRYCSACLQVPGTVIIICTVDYVLQYTSSYLRPTGPTEKSIPHGATVFLDSSSDDYDSSIIDSNKSFPIS
jgi:hypothetical protein